MIRSPEQVELEFPLAGPSTRMFAYAIDLVVIVLGQAVLLVLLLLSAPLAAWLESSFGQLSDELASGDPEVSSAVVMMLSFMIVLQLVVELAYFVIFEFASNGRSIGKLVAGLRVTRDGGLPLTFRASLVRNLLRVVDVLPTRTSWGSSPWSCRRRASAWETWRPERSSSGWIAPRPAFP